MADEFDPSGPARPIAPPTPIESAVDAAYDRYIENLEKSASDLSDDDVMKDVLDSFLASKGADPQSLSLPTPEKRLDLYKTLELEPPPPSEGELTFGSRSWYKDRNLLAPPMTYEEFLKRRYGLDLVDLYDKALYKQFASPPEPPPSEPRSTALATLAIPSEEDTSQEKPKQTGKAWRGIGSLMRKRVFPIVQVAQQAWSTLSDEQKDQVTKFLNNPVDFGLGRGEYPPGFKGGLDYFRQMLGMGPEQPEGGIASLPLEAKGDFHPDVIEGKARTLKSLEEVSQSTLKRRLKNKKKELSDILGMPIKRDITLRHDKRIKKILKGADDFTTAKINKLVDDVYLLKERINPNTRWGPSYRTHPDMQPEGPLIPGTPDPKNTIVGIMAELNLTEALSPVKRRSGVIRQGAEGIMQRFWEMSPDDVKITNAVLKQRFGKGVLDFDFPKDPAPNMLTKLLHVASESPDFGNPRVMAREFRNPSPYNSIDMSPTIVKKRIESILEPSPEGPRIVKAHGGFIDKPLYERTL